jgi:hypothetical protein
MKQYGRVAVGTLVAILCARGAVAQSQPAVADAKFSVEFTAGPTLGHKGSGFFTVEGTWRLTPKLDIFVEGGHMANVGTSELDANAQVIANFLTGATGQTATVTATGISVNHFDAGVKFWLNPLTPTVRPYLLAAVGFGSATTESAYAVNGNPVNPADFGVQLGSDLSGSLNKTLFVFGGGITVPFGSRYFADIGYRIGPLLANTSEIENDVTIVTQRVIFGVGARF